MAHHVIPNYSISKDTLCAGSVVDSWDKVREQAACALSRLPAPLPGLGSPEALLPQLQWACGLLSSPRVREADAGATCCVGAVPTITHFSASTKHNGLAM